MCAIPEVPTWAASRPTKSVVTDLGSPYNVWYPKQLTVRTRTIQEGGGKLPSPKQRGKSRATNCFMFLNWNVRMNLCHWREIATNFNERMISGTTPRSWLKRRQICSVFANPALYSVCICQQSKSLMKANNLLGRHADTAAEKKV